MLQDICSGSFFIFVPHKEQSVLKYRTPWNHRVLKLFAKTNHIIYTLPKKSAHLTYAIFKNGLLSVIYRRSSERRSRRTRNDMVNDISSADDGRDYSWYGKERESTTSSDDSQTITNRRLFKFIFATHRSCTTEYDEFTTCYRPWHWRIVYLCIRSTHKFSFGYEKQEINKRMHSRKTWVYNIYIFA